MELNDALKLIEKYGFLLTNDGYEYLRENCSYISQEDLIGFLTIHDNLFITKDNLEKLIKKPVMSMVKLKYDYKVIFDPTNYLKGGGADNYSYLFRDRYNKLSNHIKEIMRVKDITSLSALPLKKKPGETEEVYVIGLVYSKRLWDDKIMLEVEDYTGKQRLFIFKKRNPHVFLEASEIPLDSVIGFKIEITPSGIYTVKEIYYPNVKKSNGVSNDEIYVVFTSDLHIGSMKFYEDEFLEFIKILNGQVDDFKLKRIIQKIRYIIIAGDLVEGVGVFPNQREELLIEDLYDQYKHAYNLLRKIRNDIKIIIIPGNHDASRKALPQPAIFEEFAPEFYSDKRFVMLGNPVNISLHGVNIYIYHGDFIQDLFTMIPRLSRENISKALSILLKVRHTAPTYGLNTLIAPEKEDLLIIPKEIDIFHTGHTHKLYVGKISGILTINSGTWQSQTKYQKIYGITPDPLKVPIVNLKNLETIVLNLAY